MNAVAVLDVSGRGGVSVAGMERGNFVTVTTMFFYIVRRVVFIQLNIFC